MNHEVDLKNNILRTDLAVELIEKAPTKQIDDIKITNITLNKQEAEQINKKPGNYTTIEFEDVTDHTNNEKLKTVFAEELKKLLKLENIKESSVERINGKIIATIEATNEQIEVAENTLASMNLLLFTPDIFQVLETRFTDFLEKNKGNLSKAEYQIPSVLNYCIKSKEKQIDMIETNATWYGVTYKEDKESIVQAISKLINKKKYPYKLWREK